MSFVEWFELQTHNGGTDIEVKANIHKTMYDEYYLEIPINDKLYCLELNRFHDICKTFGQIYVEIQAP